MNCEYCGELIVGFNGGEPIHAGCLVKEIDEVMDQKGLTLDEKLSQLRIPVDPVVRDFLLTAAASK